MDGKEALEYLTKNTMNTQLKSTSRTVCDAWTEQPEPELASTKPPILPWMSQAAWSPEGRFGER
jgi:hypothetical protein